MRRIRAAAGGPVGTQLDQQPLPVHRNRCVGGCLDADQLRVFWEAPQLVDLVVEEVDGPAQQSAFETRGAVYAGRDDDVAARALEHRFRLRQRLTPPPPLDHPRIAGFGQRACTEVGAHQHGIRFGPADVGLGLRKREPVGNELPCGHVEFAHDCRVGAAAGHADQCAGAVRFDDSGAGPHPVFMVSPAQLIYVNQHIPRGRVAAVVLQRGAPPQPARVGGVPPEVVQVLAAAAHIWDAGIGVEHVERLGAHLLEVLAAELGHGRLVASAHPVQCVLAGDVLQPQVRIVQLVGGGGSLHKNNCGRGGTVSCVTQKNEELIR
jgi:hypothetical protein